MSADAAKQAWQPKALFGVLYLNIVLTVAILPDSLAHICQPLVVKAVHSWGSPLRCLSCSKVRHTALMCEPFGPAIPPQQRQTSERSCKPYGHYSVCRVVSPTKAVSHVRLVVAR
jgi:hypothetical protein